MADFGIQDSPILISRKIWVTEKSCNFHTVKECLTFVDFSRYNIKKSFLAMIKKIFRNQFWNNHESILFKKLSLFHRKPWIVQGIFQISLRFGVVIGYFFGFKGTNVVSCISGGSWGITGQVVGQRFCIRYTEGHGEGGVPGVDLRALL